MFGLRWSVIAELVAQNGIDTSIANLATQFHVPQHGELQTQVDEAFIVVMSFRGIVQIQAHIVDGWPNRSPGLWMGQNNVVVKQRGPGTGIITMQVPFQYQAVSSTQFVLPKGPGVSGLEVPPGK